VRDQLDDRQLTAAREQAASLGIGPAWIRDVALVTPH
jgi:hypothetical protein